MPRRKQDQPVRVAFVADVHVANHRDWGGRVHEDGLNERGNICVQSLALAKVAAMNHGANGLFICGDLFHHRRPEPAIVAAVQEVLDEEDVVFPGNHDLISATAEGGNTACAPLEPVSRVINTPTVFSGGPKPPVFCVPFDARKPMAEVIVEALDSYVDAHMGSLSIPDVLRGVALATHVGIVTDASPPWLKESKDAIHVDRLMAILQKHGMPAAFVGNYHQHGMWKKGDTTVCQIGALNPTGFADEGLVGYGGLALWDGEQVEWLEVPGPRFVKVPARTFPPDRPPGCAVYIRAEQPAYCHQPSADAVVGDEAKGEHPNPENDNTVYYTGYEEVPALEPNVLEEQDVAKPDKLLESAEQALEEYVSKQPMPEGVSRADVLADVKRLWRQA